MTGRMPYPAPPDHDAHQTRLAALPLCRRSAIIAPWAHACIDTRRSGPRNHEYGNRTSSSKQRSRAGSLDRACGVLAAAFAASLAIPFAQAVAPLPVVPQLDLDRYAGQWHEIARYPNFLERMCVGDVTAHYTRNADGTLSVVNACRKEDGSKF